MEVVNITNLVIETAVSTLAAIVLALVGVGIQYLKGLVAEKLQMQTLAAALEELDTDVAATVDELQQVLVEDLKAAHEDGKLTEDEIKMLNIRLINATMEKLSEPAARIIKAAGIEIEARIKSLAEAYIYNNHLAMANKAEPKAEPKAE
jgi:CCR4-NOT transcriptional regulation complex NOT5 subunit